MLTRDETHPNNKLKVTRKEWNNILNKQRRSTLRNKQHFLRKLRMFKDYNTKNIQSLIELNATLPANMLGMKQDNNNYKTYHERLVKAHKKRLEEQQKLWKLRRTKGKRIGKKHRNK